MSVPVWRDTLPQAVESVLTQTHSDLEFIIGTHDERIFKYVSHISDRRVLVVYWPQKLLLPDAINSLFSRATGDYIAIIHDDDYYLPTFLEALLAHFGGDSKRYAFVSSGFIREDKDGTRVRSTGTHPLACLHHSVLYSHHYIDLLEGIDGIAWDNRWEMSSDTDFMYRLLELGPGKHHNDWLYIYRTYTSLYRPLYHRFQYFLEGIEVAKRHRLEMSLVVILRNFAFMFMQAAHYAGISWKSLGLDRIRKRVEQWDTVYT